MEIFDYLFSRVSLFNKIKNEVFNFKHEKTKLFIIINDDINMYSVHLLFSILPKSWCELSNIK